MLRNGHPVSSKKGCHLFLAEPNRFIVNLRFKFCKPVSLEYYYFAFRFHFPYL